MLATAAGVRSVVVCSLGVLSLAAGSAAAAEAPWRVERAEVRVTVPLKPGGAFEATSAALSATLTPSGARPVSLAGECVLDLTQIDTGIALRNRHLREKYLEVTKGRGYDKAALSEVVVSDATGTDFQGRSGFSGSLLLHGVKRAISGTAEIHRAGTAVQVDATFPLTLTDFSIVPPEYLGVGVANKVIVKVELIVAPARSPSP